MDVDKQNDSSKLTTDEAIKPEKKKKCISCLNMSRLFAIPLISPVFMSIRDIMIQPLLEANKKRNAISFYFGFGIGSATFLAFGGIVYFLIEIKACIERTKIDIKLNYKRKESKARRISNLKLGLILLAMSICFSLHIVSICLSMYYTLLDKRIYTMYITGFYARYVLSRQINNHHRFAYVLYTFGFIIFLVFTCLKLKTSDLLPNLFSILGAIFYSLQYSLMKYLQVNYDWPIYFSHIIVGTFSVLFSMIGYFASTKLDENMPIYFSNIKQDKKLFARLIVYVICGITAKVLVAYTIYHYTLMHFVFSSLISGVVLFIYNNCIKTSKIYVIVLSCIAYIIELFALLVYNENVVLNIFGLNKNVGKGLTEIEKRERAIREENNIKKKIIYDIEEILYNDEEEEEENDDKNKIEL